MLLNYQLQSRLTAFIGEDVLQLPQAVAERQEEPINRGSHDGERNIRNFCEPTQWLKCMVVPSPMLPRLVKDALNNIMCECADGGFRSSWERLKGADVLNCCIFRHIGCMQLVFGHNGIIIPIQRVSVTARFIRIRLCGVYRTTTYH